MIIRRGNFAGACRFLGVYPVVDLFLYGMYPNGTIKSTILTYVAQWNLGQPNFLTVKYLSRLDALDMQANSLLVYCELVSLV